MGQLTKTNTEIEDLGVTFPVHPCPLNQQLFLYQLYRQNTNALLKFIRTKMQRKLKKVFFSGVFLLKRTRK